VNSKAARIASRTVVAILSLTYLAALILLASHGSDLQIGQVSLQVRWDFRDYVEYAGWRLGFRENPPFVYYADEIQQIRPESTITNENSRR
jgi:hypothetical protein